MIDKASKEKLELIEKELTTLTERLDSIDKTLKEIEDLRLEIKGLKVFLGRMHPDFKNQFLEILKKIRV